MFCDETFLVETFCIVDKILFWGETFYLQSFIWENSFGKLYLAKLDMAKFGFGCANPYPGFVWLWQCKQWRQNLNTHACIQPNVENYLYIYISMLRGSAHICSIGNLFFEKVEIHSPSRWKFILYCHCPNIDDFPFCVRLFLLIIIMTGQIAQAMYKIHSIEVIIPHWHKLTIFI